MLVIVHTVMKYELWYSRGGGCDVHTLLAADAPDKRVALEADAVVIWTVDAVSWEEACSRQHEFLGWDPYKPML